MPKLRRWQLDPAKPLSFMLAADARIRPTDYLDDQVWRFSMGTPTAPGLALQTHYGGRVGLATLIPLWTLERRVIYETLAYAKPPVVTHFAPGYLRAEGALTPQVALLAEYWAIDSHTVGGQFTLQNMGSEPVSIRFDLFGHVGAQGKELPLAVVPVSENLHALHLSKIGQLNPVVVVEHGAAELINGQPTSPKVGVDLNIDKRKKVSIRWVHAGLHTVQASLAHAQLWLAQDWTAFFRQIQRAALSIPDIETGDHAVDFALSTAFHTLVSAFLKPTASLPHASFVSERDPNTGYSRRGDGGDYPRAWSGQTPTLAYLSALGMASIDATLSQGIIRNYVAVQQHDGSIDWKPGLGGQRQQMLCLPVLARLTWGIFQFTEDETLLKDVFPGLLRFFERWLDADVDKDGLPEWQHEAQTGYVYWPSFGRMQPWGEHTDIRAFETPDLLAYLLSEAISLQAIAHHLHDAQHEEQLANSIQRLQQAMESLWNGERYQYRDRDTHLTSSRQTLLENGRGDQEHILALRLHTPARLNIRVSGGVDHTPRLKLHFKGLNPKGERIERTVDHNAFVWQHNRGIFTTEEVFSQLDWVHFEGLSRVYTVSIYTPDSARLDINALLPLWSVGLPHDRAALLVNLLTKQFLRPNGVTMNAVSDPNFDPANANGSGGVWPFWLTLIGEGLIETGHSALAADVLQRLLKAQVEALRQQGHFYEFYHSDQPGGLGTPNHLGGIVPVYLLLRTLGIHILSSGKVWTGGPYYWPAPVTVHQHGVTVTRSQSGTHITFYSGHEAHVPADAEWQLVVDPNPRRLPPLKAVQPRPAAAPSDPHKLS